jgi:ribosomal protein S18 acetylase RimI-like enzyme
MHSRVEHLSSLNVINAIVALHNEVWNNSTGIIDLLKNSSDCLVLFDENDHVIGYAFMEEDRKRGFFELQDLAVSPKHQGQGGGKILMQSIMKKYSRIKLIVRESNARLIAFYKNLGFEMESMIENYYDINEDGVRMSWQKK